MVNTSHGILMTLSAILVLSMFYSQIDLWGQSKDLNPYPALITISKERQSKDVDTVQDDTINNTTLLPKTEEVASSEAETVPIQITGDTIRELSNNGSDESSQVFNPDPDHIPGDDSAVDDVEEDEQEKKIEDDEKPVLDDFNPLPTQTVDGRPINWKLSKKSPSYSEQEICSAELQEAYDLGVYMPKPCTDRKESYLERVRERKPALKGFDFSPEVVPPEPELLCNNDRNNPRTYSYVKPLKPSCFCLLSRKQGPDMENNYAVTPFPFQREFQSLVRGGMKIKYLPTGKINFLTTECLDRVADWPQLEHYYRKIDARHYTARVYIWGRGISGYEKCMPNFHKMLICPHKNQYGTIQHSVTSISSKSLLPTTLKNYQKRVGQKCFDRFTVLPKTYRLGLTDDCHEFWDIINSSLNLEEQYGKWVLKKSDVHRGKAVELLDKSNYKRWSNFFSSGRRCGFSNTYLAQEYLLNTSLINGRKYDLRTYMFLAQAAPTRLVYFHPVFNVRLAAQAYDPEATSKGVALTNRSLAQRMGIDVNEVVMVPEQFQEYFYQNGTFSNANWLETDLYPKIRKVLVHLARNMNLYSTHDKNKHKLYGVDFMVLDNFDIRLIEVNSGPMMDSEPVKAKAQVTNDIAKIVRQKLDLKEVSSKFIDPGHFQPIYDGSLSPAERTFGLMNDECLATFNS